MNLVRYSNRFNVCLVCLMVGYAIAGYYAYTLTRSYLILIFLGLIVAPSIVALLRNLGGIIAGGILLISYFYRAGWQLGLVALVITASIVGLFFRQIDDPDSLRDRKISLSEIIATISLGTLSVGIAKGLTFLAPWWLQVILTGTIGGALITIGSEIKEMDLPTKYLLPTLALYLNLALVIGIGFGWATYRSFAGT